MPAILAIILSPLGKWLAAAAGVLAAILAALAVLHAHDVGIARRAAQARQLAALASELAQAKADAAFQASQTAKAQAAAADLQASLAASGVEVSTARSTLHADIASGKLANAHVSATTVATMAQIARLEGAR